ncbi:hypothetical protein ACT7CZ_19170, partial [Bacillus cereus]
MKLPEKDALKDIERQNYVLGFTEEDAKHLEDMKVWLEEKGKLKDKYELKDKINLDEAAHENAAKAFHDKCENHKDTGITFLAKHPKLKIERS